MSASVIGAGMLLGACLPWTPPGGGGPTTTTVATTTTTTIPTTTTTVPLPGAAIGPGQHFVGLVNGMGDKAVIYVACPGPAAYPGRTGAPVGNQTVAVHQVASGGGATGSMGRQLWAQFDRDLLHVVAFATYDTPATFPSTLQLPCEGTGTVAFTTCFGTLPCASDAVDNVVAVTFVNLAL